LWKKLQEENRQAIQNSNGVDSASEAHSAALAEEGAKTLKLAMIFELCRWAKDPSRNWQQIAPDTLRLAANHVKACLLASQSLDQMARRAEIAEEAEAILAKVRVDFRGHANAAGEIPLTRTDLTHRFAANPERRGALTASRLYDEIIPSLEKRGVVRVTRPKGKLHIYYFNFKNE
jgi:hypothetical protein